MPPRKGLSLEEKRQRLLNWFNAEHTMYNIKEIESIGCKSTGISTMQIKEILQSLLDDDLINVDKCGTQNLYWIFKYKIKLKLLADSSKLKKDIDELGNKQLKLKEKLDLEKGKRQNKELIESIRQLKKDINDEKVQFDSLNQSNPIFIKSIEFKLSELINCCEIIADNIGLLISYFISSSSLSRTELLQEFNIPEEFIDL